MANITIDYANEKFKENIYQNSFIEKFVFKNVPKDIIAFQIQGCFIFGADSENNITQTVNYSIETLPPNVDLSHLGNFQPSEKKFKIANEVSMNVDIKKLAKFEIDDFQKYEPTTTQINRIILVIAFFDENSIVRTIQLQNFVQGDFQFNKIIKIESGLLTKVNPLISSKLTDFLGKGTFSRSENEFTLVSGYVECNFQQKEYVLIVNKLPLQIKANDIYVCYTRIKSRRSGIEEKIQENEDLKSTATNWKIVFYDGFIQTYVSFDNMDSWLACGGGQEVENTDVQGFYVQGETPLTITDYKIYKSPYVKFLSIPIGYYVRIVNNKNKEYSIKKNTKGSVEIYLDKPLKDAYFEIFNERETIIYKSNTLDIDLGDVFSDTKFLLEVYYFNNIIENFSENYMPTYKEMITVKNVSDKIYNNIKVSIDIDDDNIDNVQLCIQEDNPDDEQYTDNGIIKSLAPNEIQNIYLKVTKNKRTDNSGIKGFQVKFS